MKRAIIHINEALCNGCGACITTCAEGALRLVNGKAKLVKERFCDGFGACIGDCPTGALVITWRDAEGFDVEETKAHVRAERGAEGVRRLEASAQAHDETVRKGARDPHENAG